MKKTRSDALWNELSPEQLATLEKWLFEEKLSYGAILPKAQQELGFKGSEGSLRRYYRRRRKERTMEEFRDLRERVAEISAAPGDVNGLRLAAMKVLAAYAFERVREAPGEADKWAPLMHLIVDNDRNEAMRELKDADNKLRRELKAEDQKIRREAMEFARERFHFDVMEQAVKALPQLRELAQARKDPELKDYEENAYLNKLRREMFGVVWEVRPESRQEEEEMLAARRARAEKKRQAEEHKQNREKIEEPDTPTPSSPYYQEYLQWKTKRAERDWKPGAEYEI